MAPPLLPVGPGTCLWATQSRVKPTSPEGEGGEQVRQGARRMPEGLEHPLGRLEKGFCVIGRAMIR